MNVARTLDAAGVVSELRAIVSKTYDQIDADDLHALVALDRAASDVAPLPRVVFGIETAAENNWLPTRDSSGKDIINQYRRFVDFFELTGNAEASALLSVEHGGWRLDGENHLKLVDLLADGDAAVHDSLTAAQWIYRNENSSALNARALLAAAGKYDVELAPQIDALRGAGGIGYHVRSRVILARAAVERLAVTTPEQQTARQGLVDALDAALEVNGMSQPGTVQRIVDAADQLTSLDPVARAAADAFDPLAELTTLSSRAEHDGRALTRDDWMRIVDLLEDERTATFVPSVELRQDLHRIAGRIATGQDEFGNENRRIIGRVSAARLDASTLRDELATLWRKGGDSLEPADWRRIAALLGDERAPKVATISGLKDFRSIAREIGDGLYAYDDRVEAYFAAWNADHDPAYVARIDDAMQRIAEHRASTDDVKLVQQQWGRIGELLDGRPPQVRHAVAATMLDVDQLASTRDVRSALAMIDVELGDGGASAAIATLRAQTRELVERNLQRLGGSTPDGAVIGYSSHPDYAEIGRIRANLQLLNRLEQGHSAGAGLGEDVARGTDVETIVW